jgi:hypothetical protein
MGTGPLPFRVVVTREDTDDVDAWRVGEPALTGKVGVSRVEEASMRLGTEG